MPLEQNVLIIGSDPAEVEVYTDLVRDVSPTAKVDVMSRGEASFEWISQSNYHLIVIDLKDGTAIGDAAGTPELSVLGRVKQASPGTSVVLLSDHATIEEAVAAIRLGAEDYLKKPFNLEAFKLAIKRGLDRKVVFGDNAPASSLFNLLNSCQIISASLDEGRILRIVQSYLARELKTHHAAIYVDEEGQPVRLEGQDDSPGTDLAMDEIMEIAIHAANPLPHMSGSGESHRIIERGQFTPSLFVFRFLCASDRDYFCVCLSPRIPAPFDAFENRLSILRTQIELTGKNIRQYQGVQTLAFLDDATGLYNTRYLNNILDKEIVAADAARRSFAVLFIDVDHFKKVNDTKGHLIGTRLLHELGRQLKRYVRDTDTVFRYGGDEFVAVLSPCDLATARSVAERIRVSVAETEFLAKEGLKIHFTVSIGVALYPDTASSKKAVIHAADTAMYEAKRKSRNCVYVAEVGSGEKEPVKDAPRATAPKPGLRVVKSKKPKARGKKGR